MLIKKQIEHRPVVRWILAVFCIGILPATSGCLGSYGRLKSNPTISQAFETHQIPENYKFFYYGRANIPYAIIGLDSQLKLKSRLWRPVDPGSEAYRKMVAATWSASYHPPGYPRGKDILDPQGKKIGIWYSSAHWAAVKVKMLDHQGAVMIAPDTPWDLGTH